MDLNITAEERALQLKVRQFCQEELMPVEREYLNEERVPEEAILELEEKAKQRGLWALGVPKEFGGQGASQLAMVLAGEETSKVIFGLIQEKGLGRDPEPILYACNEEQKQRYLYPMIRGEKWSTFAQTEPNAGSDPASMETFAQRVGDEYVINGGKTFIHGSGVRTDFYLTLATVDRTKHRAGVTCFIVDWGTPGLTRVRPIPIHGGAITFELSFQDCRVPVANRIGEEGEGFQLGQRFLARGRLRFGPHGIGMSERALEEAIRWSKTRSSFGQPVASRQAVQWMLADTAVEIEAMRWATYRAAWMADNGLDIRDMAARVKMLAAEGGSRCIDRCLQVHGAYGLLQNSVLSKMWVQVRHMSLGEGSVEMMRFVISRNLLRD
ncbi:MAG: acyl-CoA dehydrogenase family protein [Chloroflexi bacterium]|nr:acyl-CoA dehydrogenase family protein [Chloroflexota bacterium]